MESTKPEPSAPPMDETGVAHKEARDGLSDKFLQKLAVIRYLGSFVFTPFFSILATIIFICNPVLWPLTIAYVLWFIYDLKTPQHGGRPWRWYQQLPFHRYLADYFPMRLVKTAELPPTRNYVMANHPHGVLAYSTYANFCTEGTGFSRLFPGLHRYTVTLPIQFWLPFRREYMLAQGTISSDRESIAYVLDRPPRGYVVAIVPGGASESLDSRPDNYDLTLAKRKGFVRLALQHGADLVPVYHFGENHLYDQVSNPPNSRIRRFQLCVKRVLGPTIPIFYGRGIFTSMILGLMPYRRPVTSVVGAPIRVESAVPSPTEEEVDALHARYCEALVQLFEEHKLKYGVAEGVHLRLI